MVLLDTKLGAEGSVNLQLVGGALNLTASENTPGCTVSISASVPLTYFIDQGAQKINSPLVSSIAQVLDGVLKTIA